MAFVEYEKKGNIVVVTLNRPERLNAQGLALREELAAAWLSYRDDPEARVAIITGKGRAFSAGRDMKDIAAAGKIIRPNEQLRVPLLIGMTTDELLKPVVAAINGMALGGGLLLALAADVRIAAQSATFGLPESKVGMYASTYRFIRQQLPLCVTMEMFFTGEPISAQRAYEIGMVNRVVPDDQLMPVAMEMAEKIAKIPPATARRIKRSLLKQTDPGDAGMLMEELMYKESDSSPETLERVLAMVGKRSNEGEGDGLSVDE